MRARTTQVSPKALEDATKIVFIHIPKTGGTTFLDVLDRQYRSPQKLMLNNPGVAATTMRQLGLQEKLALDYIAGHVPYGFDPRLPRRFKHLGFLRDPIDRTVSMYQHFMHLETNVDLAQRMREERWSLMDFVRSREREVLFYSRAQISYIGGFADGTATLPPTLDARLERAVHHLMGDFDFVGLQERYDECLVYLEERFGFDCAYRRRNVRPQHLRVELAEDEREELRELLQHEIILYDLAAGLVERRLSRVDRLDEKVAALNARCEHAAEEAPAA